MKHIKNINEFKTEECDNILSHNTVIKDLGNVVLPDPEHGNLQLSVFPFENTNEWISLPDGFKIWEESLNEIMSKVPLQNGANTHYVTIDSKFFTTDEFLRREGIHVDGNFCVDPNFITESFRNKPKDRNFKSSWGGATIKETWGGAKLKDESEEENEFKASWGGATVKETWGGAKINDEDIEFKSSWGGVKTSWGGAKAKRKEYVVKEDNSHVQMDWVLPYKLTIPIGDYISDKKGGILTVSTEVGCQGWQGKFTGEILSEGAFSNMEDQLTDDKKVLFKENQLYFMSSNTPHETLLISKGKRRTFMRITLNHNYLNESIK